MLARFGLLSFVTLLGCLALMKTQAAEPINLIQADKQQGGFSFDNGREFPGAVGSLQLAEEKFHDRPILELTGDFTKGGNYVQAQTNLPDVPLERLSFWVNIPGGSDTLPIRLIDGSGQCHQLRLKIVARPGWQQVDIPVEEYFRKMGTNAALDLASQYEKWSGADDGRWHQPGKSFVILYTRRMGTEGKIQLGDMQVQPLPPRVEVSQTLSLDSLIQTGKVDWIYSNGNEFPGAKGGVEVEANGPQDKVAAMRFHADFTAGGAYVGLRKSFDSLNVRELNGIRFLLKTDNTTAFAVRLIDESGQCHQQTRLPCQADGKWQEIRLDPDKIAGGEHWGGKNDGKFHGSVRGMELMLNKRSAEDNKPQILLASIQADVLVDAVSTGTSYLESFDKLPANWSETWQKKGDVSVTAVDTKAQNSALRLHRTEDQRQEATLVSSPPFSVSPGTWQLAYRSQANLHSPDNSYQGSVEFVVLNAQGERLDSFPVGITTGKQKWQANRQTVRLPAGATQGQFRVEIKKAFGEFQIDDLSATRLNLQPVEQLVERILLRSKVHGQLFFPEQPIEFQVTVETRQPLPSTNLTAHYQVRDYWGHEHLSGEIPLSLDQQGKDGFHYLANVSLPSDRLEVGRYYELHFFVPQELGEPASEYCGFATLPEAPAKKFAPEEIPFTIRNWDNRVQEYFYLADRLGLRQIGVWGGWSAKAPYAPSGPGIDIVQKLGAKWVTTTPASFVEREGFKNYSEEALRKGMNNFLTAYADKGLGMIAQGNEPHGKGQIVHDNVRAYRAIYESVKAFDPQITVLGTSVEANEEYFQAGFQNYLDAYDFHIYEHYSKVRREMQHYRELMRKYDAVKPIHSTELGLNSQGQTRLAVARELIKKCSVFFAEGGATVSWFTIQYPDLKGRARGQAGDSHCVFDCKYNLYNPRLDAVVHYHVLNSILDKKFVDEKQYDKGVQSFLFRNEGGDCLQVIWCDEQPQHVQVAFPEDTTVKLVRIDGSQLNLHSRQKKIAVTASENPILLLYKSPQTELPKAIQPAPFTANVFPTKSNPADASKPSAELFLVGEGPQSEEIQISGPPQLKATIQKEETGRVVYSLNVPTGNLNESEGVRVQLGSGNSVNGELTATIVRSDR